MFNHSALAGSEESAQSRRLGATVWAEMEHYGVAPTPRAYELWFNYRSGVSSELTLRLASLLERSEIPSASVLDTLHSEFVAGSDMNMDALDEGAGAIQHAAQRWRAMATPSRIGRGAWAMNRPLVG